MFQKMLKLPKNLKNFAENLWNFVGIVNSNVFICELLNDCYNLGEHLTSLNCKWFVRHIYREYNEVANDLASVRSHRQR